MKKSEALEFFGNVSNLARALETTTHTINRWPENLDVKQVNAILGAAVRTRGPALTRTMWPDLVDCSKCDRTIGG